ncbi:hypothetical protein [Methanoregula sp.]|jgi:hypothetical protein|uniref:hypothetical protein n=1 Tax=Methanoregula sp. TaxID=2052170 RepID=UPI003C1C03FD
MNKNPDTGPGNVSPAQPPASRTLVLRLLVIPVLVYAIWVLECFLFGGAVHLFPAPAGPALALYTFVACILTGLVIPVFLLRRAFVSGAVTMFQFGFRSLRRTVPVTALTCLALYGCVLLFSPPGTGRTLFWQSFLLMLPTGIASVMICWVMAGTHVQALVRSGGAAISIPVGVVVTGILFALAMLLLVPVQRSPDLLSLYIIAGMLMALFFFAVRDIYATGIAVTGCMAFLFSGSIPPSGIFPVLPWAYAAAIATAGVLVGIHRYLSLHFVTIQIPR